MYINLSTAKFTLFIVKTTPVFGSPTSVLGMKVKERKSLTLNSPKYLE